MNKLDEAENDIKDSRHILNRATKLLHSIKEKSHKKKYLVLCGFDSLIPDQTGDQELFNIVEDNGGGGGAYCDFESYNDIIKGPLMSIFWFSKPTAEKLQVKYNTGNNIFHNSNGLSANYAKIFSYCEFIATFGSLLN